MNEFDMYAKSAIARCNLRSYYGLAKELGISYPALYRLKKAQSLPSCNTMIKISKLAGVPEEKALLDLAAWANADKPEVQKIWLRIAKMIGVFWLFLVFGGFNVKPCYSTENTPTLINFEVPNIYIMRQNMKNILCRFFNVLRSFLAKMGVCYG